MDSRGTGWGSNCSSSSSSNNNNSNSNSNTDRGTRKGGGGGGSPSDYYYSGGAGGDLKDSPEHSLYTTNNNDYSKYSSDHLPSNSEYSHSKDSANGDYCSSYDATCRDGYGSDYRYPVNSDYSQNQQGYSDYNSSQCYGEFNQGDYGNCSQSGYSDCDPYGNCNRTECTPSPVQVTAKVLFGSVSAISNLKQKKCTKK